MPSPTAAWVDKLSRLYRTPSCPIPIDVRTDEDLLKSPGLCPDQFEGRTHWFRIGAAASRLLRQSSSAAGKKLSEGVAAWLRHDGIAAESLEGGFEARVAVGHPIVLATKLKLVKRQMYGRGKIDLLQACVVGAG